MDTLIKISGLNVREPWANLILSGRKTVETRTYPMPEKHVGSLLAIIETPGPRGEFKARIIGIARFGPSFLYKSKAAFQKHKASHLVPSIDEFAWPETGEKWGWPVADVLRLLKPILAPNPRGIVFCSDITVPLKLLSLADAADRPPKALLKELPLQIR